MADDSTAKPPRTAADKEKSRQASRPITGKEAAKGVAGQPGRSQKSAGQKPAQKGGAKGGPAKGGQGGARSSAGTSRQGPAPKGPAAKGSAAKGGGGQRSPRSGGRPVPARPPRRSPTALLTWGAVALVLIIVVVLVVVKITGSSTPASVSSAFIPTSTQIVDDVTSVPTSVYDKVGISSSVTQVIPPTLTKGQKPLVVNGLPGIFYFGAEYCPYCAAERWAIVTSLARFGKWENLGDMESSTSDVFPGTQTFTFVKAKFTSPYVGLQTAEVYSNQPSASGGYEPLQRVTSAQNALVTTYDSSKYFPGSQGNSFPFVSIGNKALVSGASYSPSILQGLSRSEIASNLDDPTNPATQAILATSNYLSASTCHIDGQMPASVCTSKGVSEAAKALGFTS
ncbi:MAG: DUF929 family protein [Acidimicrobiales bacterium]